MAEVFGTLPVVVAVILTLKGVDLETPRPRSGRTLT